MSIGFIAPQRNMATLDADVERIRTIRTQRAWSQEQLAEIAGISYRTIQRIESGGKASFESLRAIAAAFDLDVNDLLKKPAVRDQKRKSPPPSPSFLVRVCTGRDLFNCLGGAHAGRFDHDELRSQREVDLVGGFLQEMRDYLDIWDDIPEAGRVQATFDYTARITELEHAGFWVFAAREKRPIRVGKDIIEGGQIASVLVARMDNPHIISVPLGKESIATNPPDSAV